MAEELKLTRLMELRVLKRELQGYRSNVVFAGCDVGKLLEELLVWADALAAATARAEAAELENSAWRMLVNWTHRGVDRGLDAYDDDVLIVAHDKVVFIGKSALECVKGIPALADRWVRENSPPQKKPTDEGGRGGNDGGVVK